MTTLPLSVLATPTAIAIVLSKNTREFRSPRLQGTLGTQYTCPCWNCLHT